VCREHGALLRCSEVLPAQRWVQLVAPPQATALARSVGHTLRDKRPVAGSVGLDEQAEPRILLFTRKQRRAFAVFELKVLTRKKVSATRPNSKPLRGGRLRFLVKENSRCRPKRRTNTVAGVCSHWRTASWYARACQHLRPRRFRAFFPHSIAGFLFRLYVLRSRAIRAAASRRCQRRAASWTHLWAPHRLDCFRSSHGGPLGNTHRPPLRFVGGRGRGRRAAQYPEGKRIFQSREGSATNDRRRLRLEVSKCGSTLFGNFVESRSCFRKSFITAELLQSLSRITGRSILAPTYKTGLF